MSIKCLVVEDAQFIREIYRFSLRGQNLEIIDEAVDGVEALAKIKKHQPDLVILDLVLPLKNGIEVLKEISALSPHSKCLVITSLDDEEIKNKAKALGAIRYLTKPFTKAQLLEAIEFVTRDYHEVQNG
ncbi:MAG: response regulator [Bdellovibrio sp.]|nr:response regulator [Bdellovibrio sp.]